MSKHNVTEISVNVDIQTIRNLSGMTDDEIDQEEGNIDHALYQAFRREFQEADEVKASCGYVPSLTVEAYDENNDIITVDHRRIDRAIKNAIDSL